MAIRQRILLYFHPRGLFLYVIIIGIYSIVITRYVILYTLVDKRIVAIIVYVLLYLKTLRLNSLISIKRKAEDAREKHKQRSKRDCRIFLKPFLQIFDHLENLWNYYLQTFHIHTHTRKDGKDEPLARLSHRIPEAIPAPIDSPFRFWYSNMQQVVCHFRSRKWLRTFDSARNKAQPCYT